jgi:hypothetical protein
MSAFEDIDPDQERPNPVLVATIAAPFEIPVLPVDELIATARASYNAYHHRPPAASLDQSSSIISASAQGSLIGRSRCSRSLARVRRG